MSRVVRSVAAAALVLVASFAYAGGRKEAGALVTPEDAYKMVQRGDAILVDVRDQGSYEDAHASGAYLSPLYSIGDAAESLSSRDKTIIAYCSCPHEESAIAAAGELIARGVDNVLVLEGGIRGWALAGLPLRSGARP